ncbi:hypothetical protein CRUP_031740 [Coryphaenoides rupestris]|nr:hypothetical protein CRUP_031740 [Coryphaenoides rupestris]
MSSKTINPRHRHRLPALSCLYGCELTGSWGWVDEFWFSDGSLADRSKFSDPGLMPLPDAASDLDWTHLVGAARAFEDQNRIGLYRNQTGLDWIRQTVPYRTGSDWTGSDWLDRIKPDRPDLNQMGPDLYRIGLDRTGWAGHQPGPIASGWTGSDQDGL